MNLCDHPDAVRWNPQNKVVQCHVCGQVWVPLHGTPDVLYRELVLREQARLHDATAAQQVPAKSATELMEMGGVPYKIVEHPLATAHWQLPPIEVFYERGKRRATEINSVPAKSAAELMREAGVPNMLEGRKLDLSPCHGCMHGNCHVCEHGGP
jgi:hypothetical protein